MRPRVNGCSGSPLTSVSRPSAIVTVSAQADGQSWGRTEYIADTVSWRADARSAPAATSLSIACRPALRAAVRGGLLLAGHVVSAQSGHHHRAQGPWPHGRSGGDLL